RLGRGRRRALARERPVAGVGAHAARFAAATVGRTAVGGNLGVGPAHDEAAAGEALRIRGAELLVLLHELERAGGGGDRLSVVAGLGDRRDQTHLRVAGVGHGLVDLLLPER